MKIRVLCILLSLVFLASGSAKLAALDFEVAAFERWGYPVWFMYFTGVVEVAGGIGLLIRRLSALAGACLIPVMLGAVATHIMHAEWGILVLASLILVAVATRAWYGRGDIRALAGPRHH